MSLRHGTPIVVAGLAVALTASARAQEGGVGVASSISIGAVATNAHHHLLGEPLIGAGARLSIPLGGRAFSAHVSAERQTRSAARMENFCFDFVPPGEPGCVEEPVSDDARLFTLGGGIGIAVLDRARLALDLVGDLGLGWVRVDTRGTTTTGHVRVRKQLWSGMAGFEASWSPWARLPVALEAGIEAGFLKPVVAEEIVDGYAPFEREFGFTRMRMGLAWRPARQ